MDEVTIREFIWEKDYGRVLEFQEDLYKSNYPTFIASYAFFKQIEKKLWAATKDNYSLLLVAEKNKRQIAFLWVEYKQEKENNIKTGVINQLYIIPRWRSHGIGELLLKESDNYFKIHGVQKVKLQVAASNIIAYKLYKKAGYQTTKITMEKNYNF